MRAGDSGSTVMTWGSSIRESIALTSQAGTSGVALAGRPRLHGLAVAPPRALATRRREPDVRERDPDLAEHLDRDEEAGEEEHHAEELAQLEQLRGPGAVQRVGD